MTYRKRLLTAAVLAAPLGIAGFGAQAADVVGTIQDQQQFSSLAQAIKSAGLADSLEGKGPYTIFAPTDQAFAQLPPGAGDYLMQKDNQGELKSLLQYHVVKGKELKPDDVLGKQAKVDTVEGDSLSVDGTGRMMLLVPTGLTVTRIGDRVVVERNVEAMSAPAVEVAPTGEVDQQTSQQGAQDQQQQSSRSSQQQANAAGTTTAGRQDQAHTMVTAPGDMPATKHQEQVLRDRLATQQRQTAAETEGAMPSTKHQRQVLRGQQPGEQQAGDRQTAAQNDAQDQGQSKGRGVLREANVIGEPIQADNGVIYPIDAVLVPQKILSQMEGQPAQKQQSQATSPQNRQTTGQAQQKQPENG